MIETVLGLSIGVLLLTVMIWLLPIVLIVRSDKTTGAEKLVWVVLILFFTWFAWIFYALFAPIQPQDER